MLSQLSKLSKLGAWVSRARPYAQRSAPGGAAKTHETSSRARQRRSSLQMMSVATTDSGSSMLASMSCGEQYSRQ